MEAFSDGVLAIAITLLVLDIAVRPPGTPLQQFLHAWPSYLAYVVSFLTIGAAWIAHHALTDRLERVDPVLLRLNLLFLLVISFLPFPTGLMAESLHEGSSAKRLAAVVYGITLLAIRLSFSVMDLYTRKAHLVSRNIDDPDMDEVRRKFRFVVIAYIFTIVLSVVVPVAAVVLYFAIALVMVVPLKAVRRIFSRPATGDG
jgi:uncharacterized membrane protein